MDIGYIVDGKYEILKEIGRGGMSVVYLAMDKRLNKQWAVKEIRREGKDEANEIVINSSKAEANLMKKLDHPALPRIVDIIETPETICVVMDYIEGESLDKIIKEYGAQPEEKVLAWSKQLCDVLGYLHSKNIIYRDMKPANVMLKPEGNVKIIDFGIAREKKDKTLADTSILGTKGYAPLEQYSGLTDARSDIFALGMTMHHLLTGMDPRSNSYVSARQWDPEISEGVEKIIDKCVESAPENRYQNCDELLYDLEHPELITKDFRRKQQRKLTAFFTCAALSVVMLAAGLGLRLWSNSVNNSDYDTNIASANPENYFTAVDIYPERVDAYNKLIDYCREHDVTNDDINKVNNAIAANADVLDLSKPEIADMYYDMGKLYFAEYDANFKSRAVNAKNFFKEAMEAEADFEKKEIAGCYDSICKFMTKQSTTSEHSLTDFKALFQEIGDVMAIVDKAADSEANYDKISLYYVTMLLINDQAEYLAGVHYDRSEVLELMEELYRKADSISTSTLSYVNDLRKEVDDNYDGFLANINTKYNEVEKRQQGGM